jgi:sialate O-acetylesterase
MKKHFVYLLVFFIVSILKTNAQTITMPRILGNNMVLQQNKQVPVWGWAVTGTSVTITTSWGQNATAISDANGRWQTTIQTPVAIVGEAPQYTISVQGPVNTLTFSNILVGEVWLASGQSNMWLPMRWWKSFNQVEINAANYPNIRMFMLYNKSTASTPQKDLPFGSWKVCNPVNVDSFSCIPYFFAKELYNNKALNVPIGIISVAYGGASIPDFLSAEGISGADATTIAYCSSYSKSQIFNSFIAPVIPYAIKGALWYQGEANYRGGSGYGNTQTALIKDWRKKWGYDFSFYGIQLAPYFRATTPVTKKDLNYVLPLFREFQNTLLNLPKTGIVVNADLMPDSAELYEIHPHRKLEVGQRLAALALSNDYGQTVQSLGPTFLSKTVEANKIRISFKPETLGSGLNTNDGKPISNFRIAGVDNKFYPANATIDGNTVLVWSDNVLLPTNVRYAFSDGAMTNLQNKEGFPAFPFRTDVLSGWTGATYIDIPYPVTGLNQFIETKLKIYPNPFSSLLNIDNNDLSIKSIEIMDVTGRKLNAKMESNLSINTENFKSGIYFLNIKLLSGESTSTKLIKN